MTSATQEFRRDWKNVGAPYSATRHADIAAAIDTLEWRAAETELTLPMAPGLCIEGIIAEFRMPNVTAVALADEPLVYPDGDSGGNAYYSLYGIEANYANGRVRLYVLDTGGVAVPLAADFWPNDNDTGE